MKVSIVVPAYNEKNILKDNILHLYNYCKESLGYDFVIFISDNNSTDSTKNIAQELSKEYENIKYLLIEKRGKGSAVIGGWLYSKSDIYVFMDADMAVDLKALKPLVDSVASGCDIAIGSRYHKNSKVNNYISRRIVSYVYRFIARIILETKINDLSCGFKAISSNIRDKYLASVTNKNWFFDSELIIRCEKLGYIPCEIPVIWKERRGSKDQSRVSIVSVAIEYIKELMKLRKNLNIGDDIF